MQAAAVPLWLLKDVAFGRRLPPEPSLGVAAGRLQIGPRGPSSEEHAAPAARCVFALTGLKYCVNMAKPCPRLWQIGAKSGLNMAWRKQ